MFYKNKKQPVSIEGIEFDALIDEEKSFKASIPVYPVEKGLPVSDSILLEPLSIKMTLFISRTPITWLYRHGSDLTRVKRTCEQLEKLWLSKKLVKIVTNDIVYTDMGFTEITIRKSKELGYDREVSITAQKVVVTTKATIEIPDDVMKSGETEASAGTASISYSGEGSYSGGGTKSDENYSEASNSNSYSNSGNSISESKKSSSILYGMFGGAFN